MILQFMCSSKLFQKIPAAFAWCPGGYNTHCSPGISDPAHAHLLYPMDSGSSWDPGRKSFTCVGTGSLQL